MAEETANRRIAKNAIYLYIRMLISIVVTLFTSRVILQTLGVSDFGIYNVVGGVIVLVAFVRVALRTAAQRYISYEIGQKSGFVDNVFTVGVHCHLLLSVVIFVLAETIGLWFINTYLNIPIERHFAMNCVYQLSIIAFVFDIMQMPLQASVISYEKMSFYAYLSILEVFLKLAVAASIVYFSYDKLIIYSLLQTLVALFLLLCYVYYVFHFLPVKYLQKYQNKHKLKEMLSFSGWQMFNSCTVIGAQQGGNILLNFFNGVIANAAYGIASQASNALYMFVTNFQSAFQPQIVKQYSSRQYESLFQLMQRSASFSYFLLLIMMVPFSLNADYVLYLWLGDVPEYTEEFCVLLLLYFLLDAYQAPLWMVIGATGKMKTYSLWSGIITMFNIPISWYLLFLGAPLYIVFIIRVLLNLIMCFVRPYCVKQLIPDFSIKKYVMSLRRNLITTIILCLYITVALYCKNMIYPLLLIFVSTILSISVVWYVGISKPDRIVLRDMVISIIKR